MPASAAGLLPVVDPGPDAAPAETEPAPADPPAGADDEPGYETVVVDRPPSWTPRHGGASEETELTLDPARGSHGRSSPGPRDHGSGPPTAAIPFDPPRTFRQDPEPEAEPRPWDLLWVLEAVEGKRSHEGVSLFVSTSSGTGSGDEASAPAPEPPGGGDPASEGSSPGDGDAVAGTRTGPSGNATDGPSLAESISERSVAGADAAAGTVAARERNRICDGDAPHRTFNVSAIRVDIPLNAFGDHDPRGRMYVLDSEIPAVREQERSMEVTPGLHGDPIQPLVVRANLGDCVQFRFTNRLDERASIHLHTGRIRPSESGSHVGTNEDSTVAAGGREVYTFQVGADPQLEGSWYFHSHGNREQVLHGLFGSLEIEPEGARWLDPETGEPLRSGWSAVIDMPASSSTPDFREHVILYHTFGDDTFRPRDADGGKLPLVDGLTGAYRPCTKAVNYRSECHLRRQQLLQRDDVASRHPHDVDESLSYSSYTFGPPATPMPRAYVGDPTKIRIVGGDSDNEHTHHLHGGGIRWRFQPESTSNPGYWHQGPTKDPLDPQTKTQRLDSQNVGPSETYTTKPACGAGGCQAVSGDFLFHCHVADHYIAGMWAMWRVHDTLEPDLEPLPDRRGETPEPVNSTGLVGMELPSGVEITEDNVEDWVRLQLPTQGDGPRYDASTWNWTIQDTPQGPLALGPPRDTVSWPNYDAGEKAGTRPVIEFHPVTGQPSFPLLTPHLAQRPPFAPGHGGAPSLRDAPAINTSNAFQNHDRGRVAEDPHLGDRQLCPPGSPVKRFNIVAVQTDIPLNDEDVLEEGQIYVLAENKDEVLSGERPPKPLVYRANVGDCVAVTLTSELEDNGIHDGFAKVNIHPHFVQFDIKASDGVITGQNYEQSVRPYDTHDRVLEDPAEEGDRILDVTNVDRLQPNVTVGVGLGEASIEVQRIESIDPDEKTITLEQPLVRDHDEGEAVGVEFVRYQYYVDANWGTTFFHDHVRAHRSFPRGLFGALIVEPPNSTYHDPGTGEGIRQGPIADVHTPTSNQVAEVAGDGSSTSYREAVFMPANRREEDIPVDGTINLRSEPLDDRDEFPLSSVMHGDPSTPLVEAYEGDPTVFRVTNPGPDLTNTFRVTGHHFRVERFEEASPKEAMNVGPSERFDLVLENSDPLAHGGAGHAGDYLYYVTGPDSLRAGMWGIFRVHDRLDGGLQPLPDRPTPPPGDGFPRLGETGQPPPDPPDPGDACRPGAPSFTVNVTAIEADVQVNEEDEESIAVFARDRNVPAIRADLMDPQPLMIRSVVGECMDVRLTNELDRRVSLNVAGTHYEAPLSSGITVGYNFDQGVEPGETRTYRLFAGEDVGSAIITDFATLTSMSDDDSSLGGETYGLYGAFDAEPQGSRLLDPRTGEPTRTGLQAVVDSPDGVFRDYHLVFHEEDPDFGTHVMPYKEHVDGESMVNYRSEPWEDRLEDMDEPDGVYDSHAHGDPATPLLRAYEGDPLEIHLISGFGFQTGVFSLQGHRWPVDSQIPDSELLGSEGYGVHENLDMEVDGGAGPPGDYLYQNHRIPYTQDGQWGLLRVHEERQPDLLPLEEFENGDSPEEPPFQD